MLAMGSGVRGGLAAQWPGCETNEQKAGNIKVPTDLRSVSLTGHEQLGMWTTLLVKQRRPDVRT